MNSVSASDELVMAEETDNVNGTLKPGKFYHDSLTFAVEGTLHKVPRYGFEQFSSMFSTMLQLPQGEATASGEGDGGEGSSDANPIRPPNCTNFEFESLLKVMYPPRGLVEPRTELTKEEWIGVLKLSRQWDMPEVSKTALKELKEASLTSVEKVTLGRQFNDMQWLLEGYNSLVADLDSHSHEELAQSIGWEAVAKLLVVARETRKSAGNSFMRITANEEIALLRCCAKYYKLSAGGGDSRNGLTPTNWTCGECHTSQPAFIVSAKAWNNLIDKRESTLARNVVDLTRKKVEEVFKKEIQEIEWHGEIESPQ